MKFVLVLAFIAVAAAFPTPDELTPGQIPVLKREEIRDEHGQYVSEYLGGDGTNVHEEGHLVNGGEEGPVIVKSGSVKYTSPEGQTFVLSYTADENGYHPVAEHLPKSVEV